MKKLISILIFVLSIYASSNGMAKLKEMFGLEGNGSHTPIQTDPTDDRGIDNMAFWSTVLNCLEREHSNPQFISHAKTQLRRVQTLSQHARGISSQRKKYSTLTSLTDKLKDTTKVQKAENKAKYTKEKQGKSLAEMEAFKKGKRSGQAHQRWLDKKKAEVKEAKEKSKKKNTKS